MSSIDDSWKNFHVEKRNTKETALYILFFVGLLDVVLFIGSEHKKTCLSYSRREGMKFSLTLTPLNNSNAPLLGSNPITKEVPVLWNICLKFLN